MVFIFALPAGGELRRLCRESGRRLRHGSIIRLTSQDDRCTLLSRHDRELWGPAKAMVFPRSAIAAKVASVEPMLDDCIAR
jgi:hypothetical protein